MGDAGQLRYIGNERVEGHHQRRVLLNGLDEVAGSSNRAIFVVAALDRHGRERGIHAQRSLDRLAHRHVVVTLGSEEDVRAGVLIRRANVEAEGELLKVVGAARHRQEPFAESLELGGMKRRTDQARVLEEELLRGIVFVPSEGVRERANAVLAALLGASASLVIEVREPQKAQGERGYRPPARPLFRP